jgi:hypothetical protein
MDIGMIEMFKGVLSGLTLEDWHVDTATELTLLHRLLWMEIKLTLLATGGRIADEAIDQLLIDVEELAVLNYHRGLSIVAFETIENQFPRCREMRSALRTGPLRDTFEAQWFIDHHQTWESETPPFNYQEIEGFKFQYSFLDLNANPKDYEDEDKEEDEGE